MSDVRVVDCHDLRPASRAHRHRHRHPSFHKLPKHVTSPLLATQPSTRIFKNTSSSYFDPHLQPPPWWLTEPIILPITADMKLTGDGKTVAVPRAMIALAPLDRAVNHQKTKSMATRFNNPLSPYEHPQSSVIFVPILRLGSEVLVVNGVPRPDITDAVIVGWKSWDFTGNLAAVQEALR